MESLPKELLFIIFHYLSYEELGRIRRIAKFISINLEDPYFLQQYYQEHVFRRKLLIDNNRHISFNRVHHAIFCQRKILVIHRILLQYNNIKVSKINGDRIFITFLSKHIELYLCKDRLIEILNNKGWRLVSQEEGILSYTHNWWETDDVLKIVYN